MRARLVVAAAVASVLPAFLVLGAQPAHATGGGSTGGGNKGSLKVSQVGGAADESNEPKVGCTFDLQWYGFQRSTATVKFESQAPTKNAVITKVAGPGSVELGSAASGRVMNTARTYTLKFTGADPEAGKGYHVQVTTTARGTRGSESKSKTFWVTCDRADVTTPPVTEDPVTEDPVTEDPVTEDPVTEDPVTEDPVTEDPVTEEPETEDPGTDEPGTDDPTPPFSWDWQYANPTCDALTVDYPANIPAGQANDANVRFQTAQGPLTLNFHHDTGTWSGTHVFDFTTHPQWPAGLTTYHVVWVQVGGTNYHWNGDVSCAPAPEVDEDTPFTWDWTYADPTCTALTVAYPANIPDAQANDANIRFESNVGQFTLNSHHNTGTWSGTHVFDYLSHPQWPAGVTSFHVVWTQVGGTNYHWQGDVSCVVEDGVAKAATAVQGFRTGTTTVGRGMAVAADTVAVAGAGYQDLVLETRDASGWTPVRTVSTDAAGTARVTFPKLTKKGTYQFRLAVAGSGISTGHRTGTLTVRVR
ncbi:hypothetical protein [Nocardioides aquiterrae]|uniref:Ig-like domain repeat protein n=1 Tax=Nocardioides aquiterrae TaxID=203799 RepID=A0ABP4EYZ4_9ACTN